MSGHVGSLADDERKGSLPRQHHRDLLSKVHCEQAPRTWRKNKLGGSPWHRLPTNDNESMSSVIRQHLARPPQQQTQACSPPSPAKQKKRKTTHHQRTDGPVLDDLRRHQGVREEDPEERSDDAGVDRGEHNEGRAGLLEVGACVCGGRSAIRVSKEGEWE